MSSSTSPSKIKFLRDENVKLGLEIFLKQQGVNIISKPKGISNGKLAEFSKSEKRVLVTNDEDFLEFGEEKIFSVVWLRIPQEKSESLLRAFSKLLKEKSSPEGFEGSLITLNDERFEISPLSKFSQT
ncbi:MAG: DUF5615 family PIN-like protein [Nanoarchaeota archaeon]